MATVDLRPDTLDIKAYAGDTVSLNVLCDQDYSSYQWSGQVRLVHDESGIPVTASASFIFSGQEYPYSDPLNPSVTYKIVASLSSTATRDLAAQTASGIDAGYVKPGSDPVTSLLTFSGIYDIQVSNNSANPPVVKTIVQGVLTLDADVTRL